MALRKNPYEVNMLIGGFDAGKGASLYFMDYMASLVKVDKAAHGYCSYFILSVMDKYWKPNMTLDEGIDLITKVRLVLVCLCPTFSFERVLILCLSSDTIIFSHPSRPITFAVHHRNPHALHCQYAELCRQGRGQGRHSRDQAAWSRATRNPLSSEIVNGSSPRISGIINIKYQCNASTRYISALSTARSF